VSLDDGSMQQLSLRLKPSPDPAQSEETRNWERAVIDNDLVVSAKLPNVHKGKHVVKVWRIDDDVVLTRLEVNPQ